jgi:hypothetical protein
MTLVSQIITDAFRVSNTIPLNADPTAPQQVEALRFLNRQVKSVLGNEIGDALTAFPIGRHGITRPAGYPWWNTVPDNDWFVPENTRTILNIDTSGINLYLHPDPDDGARFAAIDTSGTLATYPVTVYGNGRTIETAASITLNTNGLDSEWFYRGDLGNWQKYSPIILTDTFPFPEEFDDYFITLLAIRLNPSYGTTLDDQTSMIFKRSQSQIRARYSQNVQARSELGLTRPAKVAADRDRWGNDYWLYNPNGMFDKGWPW